MNQDTSNCKGGKTQNEKKKNQTAEIDDSMDRVTSKLSLLSDDLDISGILDDKGGKGGKSDISEQMRALV